jgi:hypothetical protein
LELHSSDTEDEDENESMPELLIMGMSRLSKGKTHEPFGLGGCADTRKAAKKDQDERTAAKERENQTHRDKEANEIREKLATQRRHPLRLRMPVVLPAVLGHPTPRNEGRNEIEDLFQQACPDGSSRFSVAGFQGGCYRQWPPPYMPKLVPRIALPHWYRRVYDMLRPLVSLATEL